MLYTFNISRDHIVYRSGHILGKEKRHFPSEELERYIAALEYLDLMLFEWALPIYRARVRSLRQVYGTPLTPEQLKPATWLPPLPGW